MIFQHTYQQVLDGDQTQLRIVVRPGDVELVKPLPTDHISFHGDRMYLFHRADETREITAVHDAHDRTRYQVGHTYAVQPGRGQKALARIRVVGIRQEDVRQININDVRHEGFRSKYEFLETWTMMHDKAAYSVRPDGTWTDVPLAQQQKSWRDWLQGQGDEKYQAWVLEFELVREAVMA